MDGRIVPETPPKHNRIRLLIDTDAANEIDDLYAIALAIRSPDRFDIEGLVATHFGQKGETGGPHTIRHSCEIILKLLEMQGCRDSYRVEEGGDPMRYITEPVQSPGAELIIERAHAGGCDDPLWVVGLGAASNIASALLLDPSISAKIRLLYHARSEWSWPHRSEQFNVAGDIPAVRAMLISGVPLVWFDTGTQLTVSMEETSRRLAPLGGLPGFLHSYREKEKYFQSDTKGFYDLGDIAWLIDRSVCSEEVVEVPHMSERMIFTRRGDLGRMRRVHSCRRKPVWELFFKRMEAGSSDP